MNFRFIHAADLHLDTPLTGLQRRNPALGRQLQDASLEAFDAIIERAIARRVLFVVFAGDLYDGIERGARAQRRFLMGLRKLAEAGIEVFIAHGNHDPEGGRWERIPSWPAGVHVFPSGEPTTVQVTRDGQVVAHVLGVSYGQRREFDNLARRFPISNERGFHLGVLHCNVDGDPDHDPYAPCSIGELFSKRYDYWALGHIHTHSVRRDGARYVVYPGSTQGRNFNRFELGPKGAVEVTVDDDRVQAVEHFPTDRVRFLDLPIYAQGLDDGRLLEVMISEARRAAADHPGRPLVVRGRIRGTTSAHRILRQASEREELLADLASAAPEGVYWAALQDETRAPLDLDALAAGDDLRAALVGAQRAWAADGIPDGLKAELARAGLTLDTDALRALSAGALDDLLGALERAQ